MKKLLFTLLIAFFCVTGIYAQLRSEKEAAQIAESFAKEQWMQFRNSNEELALDLVYAPKITSTQDISTEKTYYYLYNIGENGGFIIVSGDERAKKILGYSENNSFDENQIPEGLQYWLNYYKKELDLLA